MPVPPCCWRPAAASQPTVSCMPDAATRCSLLSAPCCPKQKPSCRREGARGQCAMSEAAPSTQNTRKGRWPALVSAPSHLHYPCPAGAVQGGPQALLGARNVSNCIQHRANIVLRAVMRLAVPCGATTLLLHGCRRLAHRCAPGSTSTAVSRPRMTAAPSTAAASTAAAIGPGPPPPPPLAAGSSGYAACIPGFLHWVDFCNNGAAAAAAGEFLGLSVAGETVGYLKPRCDGVGRAHSRCGHRLVALRHCPAACLTAFVL